MSQPEASEAWELARSTGGFVLGMALASLYGAMVLLAQGHDIWYCLVTTISLGAGLGLGMAFSVKMRVTVLLSLPHFFTKEGKMLMLVLALGMVVQGPCSNILNNFSQASESLSCGAELALNQTAERVQRAKEPLLNVLAEIKDIAQKAKVVSDHVRRFFRSIMDSVSHVARALRNVWLWLANLGKVCNQELGTPYRRCIRLFDDAKKNCERAIPFLFFLCYVIVGIKPLCGLANVALVFCVIPRYIQSFLRRQITAPLKDALERVRREFEFNISAVHRFDVSLNASKSLGEVALDIMEGVRQHLDPPRRVLGIFANISFCAILYVYIKALRYRHRYLRDDTFDNVYITRRFVEMDLWRAEQGRPTVLPLRRRERGRYIPPGQPHARGHPPGEPCGGEPGGSRRHGTTSRCSHARPAALWLSRQERRQYGLQLVGVLRHMLLGLSIILADYSLFWLLDLIRHQLQGEIIARAPAVMGVSVEGTGYTSNIFRDLVSAFSALQQGNVSVLSQRCLLQPMEPDYGTYLSIGLLYGVCLFIAVFGNHIARLRRVVCAAYYPGREQQPPALTPSPPCQERTSFLHSTILARRAGLARALRQAVMQRTADAGQGNLFLFLSARLPGFARLARFLDIQQKRCLACGMAEQPDFIACMTPSCKGLYCKECYQTLNNICSVCMGPLTYRDTGDEERDSSDEETVGLWLGAVRSLRGQEQGRQLRQRIQEVVKGQGGARRLPPELATRLQAQLKEEASEESDGGSSGVDDEDSSLSSLDFGYQEQSESSGSELEEVTALLPPSSEGKAQ
ncbi:DC-STAMP domain-containing protein 2 [Cariama cristata]